MSSTPDFPRSFEDRISRVRLWTLPVVVLAACFAVKLLARLSSLSEVADRRAVMLTVYVAAFCWWVLQAAPRPLSVRATLGRTPDRATWGAVALLVIAQSCLVYLRWTIDFVWSLHLKGLSISSLSFPFTVNNVVDRGHRTALDAVIATILLAPIVEELVFRGVIFRQWRTRIAPGKAALLTTLTFSALHPDRVTAFLSGLTMLLLYTRTRSLGAAMVFHAVCNSVSFFQTYIWQPKVTFHTAWTFGLYLLMVVCVVGAWLEFVRRSWRALGNQLPPDVSAAPAARRFEGVSVSSELS